MQILLLCKLQWPLYKDKQCCVCVFSSFRLLCSGFNSCKYSICGIFWCRCSRTHVTIAGNSLFWQSTHDVDCWHCFHHCLWENVGTETLLLLLVVKFLMYPRNLTVDLDLGRATSVVKVLCISVIHLPIWVCGGNRVNFWKWLFSCVEECWDVWSAQETRSWSLPTMDSNRQMDGANVENFDDGWCPPTGSFSTNVFWNLSILAFVVLRLFVFIDGNLYCKGDHTYVVECPWQQ